MVVDDGSDQGGGGRVGWSEAVVVYEGEFGGGERGEGRYVGEGEELGVGVLDAGEGECVDVLGSEGEVVHVGLNERDGGDVVYVGLDPSVGDGTCDGVEIWWFFFGQVTL